MTNFSTPELEPYLILAQETLRRVYAEETPQEIHEWLQVQINRLAGKGNEDARMLWADSFRVYEEIMRRRAERAALPPSERRELTWPWQTWRNFLDPLDPGMLMVISAADGMGKTLVAENLAEHWAKTGMNVVFVHFELNRSLMLDRRMVRHSKIPRRQLKAGELSGQEQAEVERANDRLRQWPGSITYVHTPGWNMERTVGEVQALITEDICDVFVVDYLEKASASPRQLREFGHNMFGREADNVEVIKAFTEATEIPAILLAQMNKAGKQQSFGQLDRTSIRGAGEKTEKANVVLLLHRENTETQHVQVRVDKNTMGPTGTFEQVLVPGEFAIADLTADPLDDIGLEGF